MLTPRIFEERNIEFCIVVFSKELVSSVLYSRKISSILHWLNLVAIKELQINFVYCMSEFSKAILLETTLENLLVEI